MSTIYGSIESLIRRTKDALEERNWEEASDLCEKALRTDSCNGQVYLQKLMLEHKLSRPEELKEYASSIRDNENFKLAMQYGTKELIDQINSYLDGSSQGSVQADIQGTVQDYNYVSSFQDINQENELENYLQGNLTGVLNEVLEKKRQEIEVNKAVMPQNDIGPVLEELPSSVDFKDNSFESEKEFIGSNTWYGNGDSKERENTDWLNDNERTDALTQYYNDRDYMEKNNTGKIAGLVIEVLFMVVELCFLSITMFLFFITTLFEIIMESGTKEEYSFMIYGFIIFAVSAAELVLWIMMKTPLRAKLPIPAFYNKFVERMHPIGVSIIACVVNDTFWFFFMVVFTLLLGVAMAL